MCLRKGIILLLPGDKTYTTPMPIQAHMYNHTHSYTHVHAYILSIQSRSYISFNATEATALIIRVYLALTS